MCYNSTKGGMGSLASLLGSAYRPSLVAVLAGVDAAPVSRREICDEADRALSLCHLSSELRVPPSLLSQSDSAFFTSRLEHRYAALPRSVNWFGATRSNSSGCRISAEAIVASLFLLFDRSTPLASSFCTISETCIALPAFSSIGRIFTAIEFRRRLRLITGCSSESVLDNNLCPAAIYCCNLWTLICIADRDSWASLIWARSSDWFMPLHPSLNSDALKRQVLFAITIVIRGEFRKPTQCHYTTSSSFGYQKLCSQGLDDEKANNSRFGMAA